MSKTQAFRVSHEERGAIKVLPNFTMGEFCTRVCFLSDFSPNAILPGDWPELIYAGLKPSRRFDPLHHSVLAPEIAR